MIYYYYYYYYYYCCCKTLSRRVWMFITTCTTAKSGILSSARWIQSTPQRTISLRFVFLYLQVQLHIPNGISPLPPQCYTFHPSVIVGVFWALLTFILKLQNRGSMQFPSGIPLFANLHCCLFLLLCSLQWITCFEKSCTSDLHYQIQKGYKYKGGKNNDILCVTYIICGAINGDWSGITQPETRQSKRWTPKCK